MALPATENFATANDPLSTSSDWGQCGATSDTGEAASGVFIDGSGNSNDKSAYWVSDTFADDQYAQIVANAINSGATHRIGLIVHGGSGNEAIMVRYRTSDADYEGYYYNSSGTRIALSGNPKTPSGALTATDTMRIEISGTTLTLKVDYGAGFVTEATWDASSGPSSGSAGIYIAALATNTSGDDWEGGDLAGAASVPIGPLSGPFGGPISGKMFG